MFSQVCCNSVVIYLRILVLISLSDVINTCTEMNCHVPVHTSSFVSKINVKSGKPETYIVKKNCEHFTQSLS